MLAVFAMIAARPQPVMVVQRRLLANGGSDTDPLQHASNGTLLCYTPVAVAAHTVAADFMSSAAGS